jgi:drug/metabolite transporter (DMT)-like permease|tara:strand:- start:450 stop:944 length:495 start_codon:yes stop_codon:yes gene_type:complete
MRTIKNNLLNRVSSRISAQFDNRLIGITAALISALGYGSGAIASKHVVTNYTGPVTATAFSLLFGAILVFALFYKDLMFDFRSSPSKAWIPVIFTGISASIGVTFWFLSMVKLPLVMSAPIVGAYPLVSIILAWVFIRRLDRITWKTLSGALLVITGITLISIG